MPLTTGQILNNRYRIVKMLGQGGFGAVYRVWDLNLERPRALKENLETSPEAQRQFKREAQILTDLEHPNLPRVTDYFIIPDQGQYLVMDYVEGEDLQEKLDQAGGPLPEWMALPWIGQVGEALAYLHSQNPPVIHRDIKPANIRIAPDAEEQDPAAGKAKLVDFGIAKVYDPHLKTTVGARAITPGYSPPEQYGAGKTDAQSDIYALGATLYALLTGVEPPASVDIVSGNVRPPRPAAEVNPAVTPKVSAAVERAMRINRAERFNSVGEFLEALAAPPTSPMAPAEKTSTVQVSSLKPVEAYRTTALPQPAAPAAARPNRRVFLAGALTLLVLAALAVGITAVLNRPEPAAESAPTAAGLAVEEQAPEPPTPSQAPEDEAPGGFIPITSPDPGCDYGGRFARIQAVDEFTVQFNLCEPEAAFLAKIAHPAFAIQSSEYLEATRGGGELLERPVGTGPYQVAEWRSGEALALTAFPEYWGERPIAEELIILWEPDAETRYARLLAGAVDAADNPPAGQYEPIASDPSMALAIRPPLSIFYIGMNNKHTPFDDEHIRQAIAMGIDRQRIVERFFPAGSEVATHFTPCAVPAGCAGEPWYEFNPDLARELLGAAGYPDGFATELAYREAERTYLPDPGGIAHEIQSQLRENLNIRAEIVVMDANAFFEAIYSGSFGGLHLLGWTGDYPDATNFLDPHFGMYAPDQFGEKFPDIVEMISEARLAAGTEERWKLYDVVNGLIREHVPAVPVAHASSAVGYRAEVQNPQASPLGLEAFYQTGIPGKGDFVFLQGFEPASLYCADESDLESMRACAQVSESLFRFTLGGAEVEPGLAETCEHSEDLREWTCTLRQGVRFHDGSTLDANDVVLSFLVMWDAAHPYHRGRTGNFYYWRSLWGEFLNQP